jgi:outer membrane protein OmpA-like peptidoglycan-associated protein
LGRRRRQSANGSGGGGVDLWAQLAYLLAGLLAVMLFVAALPQRPVAVMSTAESQQQARLHALVRDQAELSAAWQTALGELCGDALLQAEGMAPDCESGAITFGDHLFDEEEGVQLTEEGIRKLHVAIDTMLRRLRAHPRVWEHLEAIELRGHADPRARRDPYVTNMRVSQMRPMAIMFYLISDWGLSERDRADIQNLLVLSAASYSRPPRSCPEKSRECYPYWRRVEMIPRMSEVDLRARVDDFVRELQELVPEAS